MEFKDLEFKAHKNGIMGQQAVADFGNGYGVSVVTGPYFYCTPGSTFELAILKDDSLVYDTPVHEKRDNHDVFGHLTPEEVSEIMAETAAL